MTRHLTPTRTVRSGGGAESQGGRDIWNWTTSFRSVDHLAEWMAANDAKKLVPLHQWPRDLCNYPEEIHSRKPPDFHLASRQRTRMCGRICSVPAGLKRPSLHRRARRKPPLSQLLIKPQVAANGDLADIRRRCWWSCYLDLLRMVGKNDLTYSEPGPCPPPAKLRPYNLWRTRWFLVLIYVFTGDLVDHERAGHHHCFAGRVDN